MNKDILCLYYSRTGHTKFAMEEIAAALDCECVEMRDRVDHVADVSLRIGSAGYHFWRDEFIRNVTNYMTAEN